MEEFYCALCKAVPKFPLTLPCCLRTICKDHKPSNCTICELDLTDVALQSNTVLLHYFNSKISVKCDRCEVTPSTISCHNCKVSLCRECSGFIHSEGIYARHVLSNCSQLMNNVDGLEICPVHKLPLKFFCSKDWVGLCRRCKEGHNNHGPVGIEEVFNGKMNEILMKTEGLEKVLDSIKSQKIKCSDFLDELNESFELSKKSILNRFKVLKQVVQYKEQELLREIEVIYNRKRIEIEYLLTPLQRNEEKLAEIISFTQIVKDLNPNAVLSQIKFIEHILTQGSEIDPSQVSIQKPSFPIKFDLQPLITQLESISISDDTLTNNNSASNCYATQSSFKSPTPSHQTNKSPQLRMKSSIEKPKTPIKSRSNSRESNYAPQSLEENPLEARLFIKKLQSSTAIQVSWNHPTKPVQGLNYCLEYGVGTKLNNIEQFRQVYKGTAHTCIITDLLPKTSYRFRVAASLNENKGEWSEVITVTTFDLQRIDQGSFAAHANVVSRAQEKFIQFDKPGVILACYAWSFGKYTWELKVFNNALYPAEGNCLRVGVCGSKSKVVHGLDIDYQSTRGSIKIKLMLDIENKTLYISNGVNNQTESVYSLPEGPLTPAIQYKPVKSSTAPVRISVDFDM